MVVFLKTTVPRLFLFVGFAFVAFLNLKAKEINSLVKEELISFLVIAARLKNRMCN